VRRIPVRLLAASLYLGSAYDAFFGLGTLYFAGDISRWTGIPLPEEPSFMYLSGVLLLILAAFYAAAAVVVERAPQLPAVAAAGRFLGFLFFWRLWRSGYPAPYLAFGLVDLALAAAHGGFLLWAVVGMPRCDEAAETEEEWDPEDEAL
jgi:hypothetical protein